MSYTIEEVILEDNRKQFIGIDPYGTQITNCILDMDGYIRAFSLSQEIIWYGENKGQKVLAVFKKKKSNNAV